MIKMAISDAKNPTCDEDILKDCVRVSFLDDVGFMRNDEQFQPPIHLHTEHLCGFITIECNILKSQIDQGCMIRRLIAIFEEFNQHLGQSQKFRTDLHLHNISVVLPDCKSYTTFKFTFAFRMYGRPYAPFPVFEELFTNARRISQLLRGVGASSDIYTWPYCKSKIYNQRDS